MLLGFGGRWCLGRARRRQNALAHCEFSWKITTGLNQTSHRLCTYESFQRQVRLICTFAFSHTAPSGNYKKSSWLQCMCENGFAVFDFSPFFHFFHSLSLPVSVLALWNDLWFCIWDIFLMVICRQIKSCPFFQQDLFQNSSKVFYQVQFVPVLHSESIRLYFYCRFLFPLTCQRLIAFKNILAQWHHAAQIRACFLAWRYT